MNRKVGFTLIELLVVIAIIAILAGIIFPVFMRAKDSAYRSSDMSNLNSIRTALQLYRADQGAYPPTLLGYATGYSDFTPTDADIIPANQVVGALYPKRVDSLETLRPAYDRTSNTVFTTAVWPTNADRGGVAGSEKQRFAFPTDTDPVNRALGVVGSAGCQTVDNYYYRISGYDVALITDANGERSELRYAPFWSGWTVPADPCSPTATEGGSANDSKRQLGYLDPPEDTVITWDSYFREYTNGVPDSAGKRDIVLFLSGAARPFDSRVVADHAWQVNP